MQAPQIWDTMGELSALTGLPYWHMVSLVPCTCGAQQVSRACPSGALVPIMRGNRVLSLLDLICAAYIETCRTCRSPAGHCCCGLPPVLA